MLDACAQALRRRIVDSCPDRCEKLATIEGFSEDEATRSTRRVQMRFAFRNVVACYQYDWQIWPCSGYGGLQHPSVHARHSYVRDEALNRIDGIALKKLYAGAEQTRLEARRFEEFCKRLQESGVVVHHGHDRRCAAMHLEGVPFVGTIDDLQRLRPSHLNVTVNTVVRRSVLGASAE